MNKIRIGTGGIPLTVLKRDTISGIQMLRSLGLDHFEVEFVRNVYIKEDVAQNIKDAAEQSDISMTIHAPYYINLASDVPKTFYGSINHIVKSLYIGGLIGAKSVTYHSAYFQKKDPNVVSDKVFSAVKKIHEEAIKKNNKLKVPVQLPMIAPELTGKPSQFGSLEELVMIAKRLKEEEIETSLCIDFAHYFARTNAEYNTYDQFSETLEYVRDNLGEVAVQNLHMHISGIMHSPKGERHHVTLLSSLEQYKEYGIEVPGIDVFFDGLVKKGKNGGSLFDWQGVLKALKTHDIGGYLVCESPILELDALLIQDIYDTL